jgi:hypothetical protein
MDSKVKLFLVDPKDLSKNLGSITDAKLRRCLTNFVIQFNLNSGTINNAPKWDNDWPKNLNYRKDLDGQIFTTKGMPSYQDFITEKKFDDILDEFISGLLGMDVHEKSAFLKTLEGMMEPINKEKTNPDNIYNIINTIYYNHSDNDLFNSIKVSILEKTGTVVLSSYNLGSIENVKAKLVKEGIENIRYRIIQNPYNQKKIHTIMYDKIGEK